MAQIIVRNLDDSVKMKLSQRARKNGHSTEEEVRDILRNAVGKDGGRAPMPLGARFKARFRKIGLTREIPELRGQQAQPATLIP
jgi:plasmid stability protein